jgi:hypothetical protein
MKAFIKTLFGDTWNIAGVALIVAVGAGLMALHRADLAVFAMPAAGLGVVAMLARH